MIDTSELKTLLNDLESDRVERTVSVTDTNKFSEAVCAFANDLPNNKLPGYLIIGAKDDGVPVDLDVTDQLLVNLASLRSDGLIQPVPQITVQKMVIDGKSLAVVEVYPSHLPPVRYKGKVCVRVGPRKAIATEQEERALTEKRISSARSFDASCCPESSLSDLSIPLFVPYRQGVVSSDVIEANHRSIEEQLASLRFFDTRNNCTTYAGLLLFGKNPRYFLPGAYVQYLKISGTQLTDDILDQAEISGDLLTILRELDTRVKVNIQTVLQRESTLSEKSVYDYPERAIRELLMNAIMHRDYQSNAPVKFYWFSDRIEIHSPGGLYGLVTMESLKSASDYRNPVIAEAMKALGYVNRYGYGIQNAQASLKENGNSPAEFLCDGRVFLATLRKKT